MNENVLVLNGNYEPLNVCTTKRAMCLVVVGKAAIVENGRGVVRTPSRTFQRPSVIRLTYMIHRPRPEPKLTRQEIFRRDRHQCQYCGRRPESPTIDHVVPQHRGGRRTWENLVTACPECNRRKGGRTAREAGMPLRRQPRKPPSTYHYLFRGYLTQNAEWGKFLQGWS